MNSIWSHGIDKILRELEKIEKRCVWTHLGTCQGSWEAQGDELANKTKKKTSALSRKTRILWCYKYSSVNKKELSMSWVFELDEVRKITVIIDNMEFTGDLTKSNCCAMVGIAVWLGWSEEMLGSKEVKIVTINSFLDILLWNGCNSRFHGQKHGINGKLFCYSMWTICVPPGEIYVSWNKRSIGGGRKVIDMALDLLIFLFSQAFLPLHK